MNLAPLYNKSSELTDSSKEIIRNIVKEQALFQISNNDTTDQTFLNDDIRKTLKDVMKESAAKGEANDVRDILQLQLDFFSQSRGDGSINWPST